MISFQQLKQQKTLILSLIVLCVLIIFFLGIVFLPSIFYDQFIWKYFWGPVVEDALNKPVSYNGIPAAQKFTLISELIYGIIVIIALYGLLQVLKKWKISIDTRFFIAILPYVLYGSVVRVLEDASYFSEPFVYWFVTPLVYFQALFLFLLFFFIGLILSNKIKLKQVTPHHVVFIGGLCSLLPFLYVMALWFLGDQWSYSNGVRFDIIVLISIILLVIISLLYCIGRFGAKRYPMLNVYTTIINLSMIIGHMLDGITSWISIYDPFNMGLPLYVEKHPASDMLMQIWPPLFPIVKFLLIIIVIYFFDVLYKKDLEEYQRLVPLLKIGIFILGFAPGLRDLLRVSMGV